MTDEPLRPAPRRRWTPARIVVAVVIAVAVLGVGTLAVVKAPQTKSGPSASRVSARLESSFEQDIKWQKCGPGYSCAAVAAPLNWDSASSDTISLALVKHTATGTREGTLLANPGGPGGSGIDLVGGGVTQAVDSTVAEHFDVIGFDPRGVGYSSAVKCYGAKQTDALLYDIPPGKIGSAAWITASTAADKKFAAMCATNTGSLLKHLDTASIARDMDLIRADLGEKKLDYLGYSWGTYLGTIYAGLFPSRVGKFVLDGADDPWAGGAGSTAQDVLQAKGFEGDLTSYLTACLAGSKAATGTGSCPFTGTPDQGLTEVKKLLSKVAATPLTAKDGRRLGDATLATAIDSALYTTKEWPSLTTALRGVQTGDPAAAFGLADRYNGRTTKGTYPDNMTDAFVAMTCNVPTSHTSLTAQRAEAAKLVAAAPVLGIYEAYSGLMCDEWKASDAKIPKPVTAAGAAPILVVGSTGDPATPYSEAVALAKQLKSGHLLTRVGEGHTAYNQGNVCINSAVDGYLTAGTLPLGEAARCS